MIFQWLRDRKEAERLAQSDAIALIRAKGAQACWEALRLDREQASLPEVSTAVGRSAGHWRRVALIIAKQMGHRILLNATTGMNDGSWLE